MIWFLENLLRLFLWTRIWSIIGNILCAFQMGVCSATICCLILTFHLGQVNCVFQIFYTITDFFSTSLINYWEKHLKISGCNCGFVYFHVWFRSASAPFIFKLRYYGNTFRIIIFSWGIDFFAIMKSHSISLVISFALKPTFFSELFFMLSILLIFTWSLLFSFLYFGFNLLFLL